MRAVRYAPLDGTSCPPLAMLSALPPALSREQTTNTTKATRSRQHTPQKQPLSSSVQSCTSEALFALVCRPQRNEATYRDSTVQCED
eukprot:927552-Prymnesium_polylepis.1